jgi:hypothetical protein
MPAARSLAHNPWSAASKFYRRVALTGAACIAATLPLRLLSWIWVSNDSVSTLAMLCWLVGAYMLARKESGTAFPKDPIVLRWCLVANVAGLLLSELPDGALGDAVFFVSMFGAALAFLTGVAVLLALPRWLGSLLWRGRGRVPPVAKALMWTSYAVEFAAFVSVVTIELVHPDAPAEAEDGTWAIMGFEVGLGLVAVLACWVGVSILRAERVDRLPDTQPN